ncbi:MAG TPA: hypothetical protein VNC50_07560, partial [Planctomycetia bacterium]|nr:hypothetical protein [Planctomycetia bacterium]
MTVLTDDRFAYRRGRATGRIIAGVGATFAFAAATYLACRVDVPPEHVAVLIKRTGRDLSNDQLLAPGAGHKGVQSDVLTEGRY